MSMKINEHISYWIDSALEDIQTAYSVFEINKYTWSLFIAHLSLEKIIKAYYIFNTQEIFPPKTHNLLRLSSLSGLVLEKKQELFFAEVNRFNIAARYPDIKEDLFKIAGKDFTKKYLDEIYESIQWIKYLIIL